MNCHRMDHKRNNELSENPFYVPPKQFTIGTRWESKKVKNRVGKLIQVLFILFIYYEA